MNIMKPALLILWFTLLFSCKSDGLLLRDKETRTHPLMAKVFNGESRACQGVHVSLKGPRGIHFAAYTDVSGKALFGSVPTGLYQVSMVREDYESIEFSFHYQGPDQALYGRMYSRRELIKSARSALDTGDWNRAGEFLNRAEKIENTSYEILFLRAVCLWKMGDAAGAVNLIASESHKELPLEILQFYEDLLHWDIEKKEEIIEDES